MSQDVFPASRGYLRTKAPEFRAPFVLWVRGNRGKKQRMESRFERSERIAKSSTKTLAGELQAAPVEAAGCRA